jgi:glycosyltransferase involved in cell wall biosynthesis
LSKKHYIILVPVFNDWTVARILLQHLARVLENSVYTVDVLLVDDGSNNPCPENFINGIEKTESLQAVHVLSLRRNLGHQRAIAIGLTYINQNFPGVNVAIMDSDGEDRPEDLLRLFEAHSSQGKDQIVFAGRSVRSEGLKFRLFYQIYRLVFRLLTGQSISMGNFSVLSASILDRMVAVSELWNHYVAAVFKARIPHTTIPTVRGTRYEGRSGMNTESLIIHGLSSAAVFTEKIGTRALGVTSLFLVFIVIVIGVVIAIRLTTDLAVPGWASYMVAILSVMGLNALVLMGMFVFLVLGGRNQSAFIPSRDFGYFILHVSRNLLEGRPASS